MDPFKEKMQATTELLWTIDSWKTAARVEKNDAIESPVISIYEFDQDLKWQLRLFPTGYVNPKSVYMQLISCNKQTLKATCTISFLNNSNQKVCTEEITDFLFTKKNYVSNLNYKIENIQDLLNEDSLKILCKLTVSLTSVVEKYSKSDLEPAADKYPPQINYEGFEEYLNNKVFSDVIFKIGRKQIHSHRVILAAKSDVFARMFGENDTQKTQNSVIKIDMKYEIFLEMLRYIYTGNVNAIEKIAADLLIAAFTYSVQELIDECEKVVSDNVTIDSVIPYLDIAFNHNIESLKKKLVRFVSLHKKSIVNMPEFKKLGQKNPDLLVEILQAEA